MLTNHSYQHPPNPIHKFSPHSIDDAPYQHKNPLYRSKNFHKKINKDVEKIRKLSLTGSGDSFSLFTDSWNEGQKRWMGIEGKLSMIL